MTPKNKFKHYTGQFLLEPGQLLNCTPESVTVGGRTIQKKSIIDKWDNKWNMRDAMIKAYDELKPTK